jgi:hypothetical protein
VPNSRLIAGLGLGGLLLALIAFAARGSSRAATGSFSQPVADSLAMVLATDGRVGQTFQVEQAGLYRIDVELGGTANQMPGRLVLHVSDQPFVGPDLAQVTLAGAQLSAADFTTFEFAPLAAPAGQSLAFWLEAPQAPTSSALIVKGARRDVYPGGRAAFVAALDRSGPLDLAFRLYYQAGPLEALPVLLARQAAGRPGIFGWSPLYGAVLLAYVLGLGGLLVLAYRRLKA